MCRPWADFLEGGYAATVLCNEGEVDVEPFQWACYNYILGLPLEERHDWAVPSGKKFFYARSALR